MKEKKTGKLGKNGKTAKENRLLIGAAVLCVIALVVMTAALAANTIQKQKEFTPPPFEAAAVSGTPDVPEGLGWSELDAQAFKAAVCGVITAEDGSADVWLTNPETNEVWLKLRVLDLEGTVLGETGLIRPGEYVQSVAFTEVPESGSALALKLMAYEPETYYSAGAVTLNTVMK